MARFCKNCGQEVEKDTYFCINCGARVDKENSSTTSSSISKSSDTSNQNNNSNGASTNRWSFAGLIVSIASMFLCCNGLFAVVGLTLSIIGLIKSNNTNSSEKTLAIAGIVIAIIALCLGLCLHSVLRSLFEIFF